MIRIHESKANGVLSEVAILIAFLLPWQSSSLACGLHTFRAANVAELGGQQRGEKRGEKIAETGGEGGGEKVAGARSRLPTELLGALAYNRREQARAIIVRAAAASDALHSCLRNFLR